MTAGAQKPKSFWSSATGVTVAVIGLLTALAGLGKEWLSFQKEAGRSARAPVMSDGASGDTRSAAQEAAPERAGTIRDTLIAVGLTVPVPFHGDAGRPLLVWVRPVSDTAAALMRIRITNPQGEPAWSPDPGTSWGKVVRELKEPFTPPRTGPLVLQVEGVVGAGRIHVAVRPLT